MIKKYLHIICLTLLLLLLQVSAAGAAQNHIVKKGDTLWDIANRYGISVDSLKQSNRLTSDRLQIGWKLTINSSVSKNPEKSQAAAYADNVYIVRGGDNLWTIARKFNTTVAQLISLNNLSSDRLDVEDRLYVTGRPATSSRAIPPRPVAAPPVDSKAAGGELSLGAGICQLGARYLGTPYRYGGSSPSGFDCSGFVSYIFKQYGYNLPRTAASMYGVGSAVDKSSLRAGDLVFFKGPGASCINHVGIFVDNNQFIHSSSGRSRGVTYSSLNAAYYFQYYAGAKRILPE